MHRILLAAGLLCYVLSQACTYGAERSDVFCSQDDRALDHQVENERRVGLMVDALVCAVTRRGDIAQAWHSLVRETDTVGIKVSAAGGRSFSTHHGVVAAIARGLSLAGVPREKIIVWDRNSDELREAGFFAQRAGWQVQAVDPPRGLDKDASISAPALGKLMWGDLLFVDGQRKPFGKPKMDSDGLSSTSFLARIVSREVTKIINVPVLSDERGCGVAGALYNVTIPDVDNWRRFTQTTGRVTTSPAEIYADERIGPKVVLHVMDGLLAEYAGGPRFEPNYVFAHQTIYASTDPVAIDAVALQRIEQWRKEAKLPAIGHRGEWLETATELGLGNSDLDKIDVRPVEIAR